MKPILLLLALHFCQSSFSQSLDYLSVRKANGRVVKNIYAGSNVVLQTTGGQYLQGPVKTIRADSILLTLYDVRLLPTNFGGYVRDTVATTLLALHYKEISRVYTGGRSGFLQRTVAPLLMIGGAGYLTLNLLNGALFSLPVTSGKNLRTLGISAGGFGLGFLLHKLLGTDGFSGKRHRLVYVDL